MTNRFTLSKTKQIENFLRLPEARNMSNKAIAERFGSQVPRVSHIRNRMGLGLYKRRPVQGTPETPVLPTHLPTEPGEEPPPVITPAQEILQSTSLTPQEQRERLSWLASHADRESDQVSALRALQSLEAKLGASMPLGPGPPLTREDRIRRLALLMEACGTEIVHAALERASVPTPAPAEPASPSRVA